VAKQAGTPNRPLGVAKGDPWELLSQGFVFIGFMLRILGRRELSSLGPTDLVLLVVMGDLIQNGVTQSDYSVTGVFLAVSTIGLMTLGMSIITVKSPFAQRMIEGTPLILVQDGKPVTKNLKAEPLNLCDIKV
jgi:uncharacterized membrane protein YcaP (DUF421 family)